MDKKRLLLIDFNNVLYAHYFTKQLTNSKGQHVQGIVGFMHRLKNLRDMFNPDYIVIARDLSRSKTFRRELYPAYKSTRKPTDNDAIFQVNETIRLLSLMGYPILAHEKYEADDIIGMCSALGTDLDMDVIIVSGDRDIYQLINDNTCVWSFRKEEIIDKHYMMEHYMLKPNQWVDLKILQGDPSDNIPGIPGIGNKTALELMRAFGSISGIYNNADKLSRSLRDKLYNGKSSIQMMRVLVTIITDYTSLDYSEENFKRGEVFKNELYEAIGELEIPSILNIIRYDLLPEGRREEDVPGESNSFEG